MGYHEWFEELAEKHRTIVEKCHRLSDDALVDYFLYENMVEKEPDYCPLYATGTKCHRMEDLNCYLCGCPEFRFCDGGFGVYEGKKLYSYCAIDSRHATWVRVSDGWHLDCSGCTLPHHKSYILKHFDRDWKKIMKEVECGEPGMLSAKKIAIIVKKEVR